MASCRELENSTPQAGIFSPTIFNLLMEQLVSLPFQEGTAFLSYADDLAWFVKGRGEKITKAHQALDLLSHKCRELDLKISVKKSKVMALEYWFPTWG